MLTYLLYYLSIHHPSFIISSSPLSSDPPNVTVTPSDELTVNVTFKATLTCTVFAIPLPNITWIKDVNDSVVSEETGRVSITEIDSINTRTSVLSFSSTLKSDESSYTCVATNDIENVLNTPTSATTNLIVQGTSHLIMF